ncbi:MAG: hypothetical protein RIG77_10625 [Cyclobacteriaceae bacterium]
MAKENIWWLLVLMLLACSDKPGQLAQNPSPMQEHIRPHERVDGTTCEGKRFSIDGVFDVPIEMFIPAHWAEKDTTDLIIHFHGSSSVTEWAGCQGDKQYAVATVNLGSGSGAYERPLLDPEVAVRLLHKTRGILLEAHGIRTRRILVSGFSAGYGAVRALLGNPKTFGMIDGVLLLDGLHTDYIPDKQLLSNGGRVNGEKLGPFLQLARMAVNGGKGFVFTHSSIFPGTYASTTECADYLINELSLKRNPVLRQGPNGMQQVGETTQGRLHILAFAGNTAPDHIDHLHGLSAFIGLLGP